MGNALYENFSLIAIAVVLIINARRVQVKHISFSEIYNKMDSNLKSFYSMKKVNIWGYTWTFITVVIILLFLLIDMITKVNVVSYVIAFLLIDIMLFFYLTYAKSFLLHFCKK